MNFSNNKNRVLIVSQNFKLCLKYFRLGMSHDGRGANKDCDLNKYIMSPYISGGKVSWSKCSIRQFRNALCGLNME